MLPETNWAGKSCKTENTLLGMVVIWFESPRDDATQNRSLFPTNLRLQKESIRQQEAARVG